jgi:hypothetical protein
MMEKLELTLVEMESCPDDVVINVLGPYEGSLLEIYQNVRDQACTLARNSSERQLVEMERNLEGFPIANIYNDKGVIYRQIFATAKTVNEAIETESYKSAVGEF